jgi:hypothetical protein
MWMLAMRLGKWNPRLVITGGLPEITNVRMFSGDLPKTENTLFMGPAGEIFDDPVYRDKALLIHKRDMIFVDAQNPEDLLNDVFAALDFYNSWEEAVLCASEGPEAFKNIIELSESVLENQMALSMLDGAIIFASKNFYNTAQFSFDNFEGFITPDGKSARDWTNIPSEYFSASKAHHFLGFYITVKDERVGIFSVRESNRPFSPGDLQCLFILKDVFSRIASKGELSPIRPNAAVLEGLLKGLQIDKSFINQLDLAAPPPPRILSVFKMEESKNTMIQRRNIEQRLKQLDEVDFALDYSGTVLAICTKEKFKIFEKIIKARFITQWEIVISLPFSDWASLPFRYRQALYALERGNAGGKKDETQSIVYCKDYAFSQIMELFCQNADVQELLHPALEVLERYDEAHKSSLGKTLFCFLENERNMSLSAQKLFLHRNSLRYRLEQIVNLTGVDLDNPAERAYIYVSYLLSGRAL